MHMSDKNDKGFYLTKLDNGWTVGRFTALDELDGVVHMVTTRDSLDPAMIASDRGAAAEQAAQAIGLNAIGFCEQIHGREILGANCGGLMGKADGLVSNVTSLGVMAFSADCPLVMIADSVSGAVGVAHASWRGTVGRIASELVMQMHNRFDASPDDLTACIGPSAGPCCYEVKNDVFTAVIGGLGRYAERFFVHKGDKLLFDLWAANVDELMRAGVPLGNIHCARVCTICCNEKYPSYRAEGDKAGRFVAVIGRK